MIVDIHKALDLANTFVSKMSEEIDYVLSARLVENGDEKGYWRVTFKLKNPFVTPDLIIILVSSETAECKPFFTL